MLYRCHHPRAPNPFFTILINCPPVLYSPIIPPAGFSCQLYSPHTRQIWQNALSTSDPGFLRQNAVILDLVIACALKRREFPIECRGAEWPGKDQIQALVDMAI